MLKPISNLVSITILTGSFLASGCTTFVPGKIEETPLNVTRLFDGKKINFHATSELKQSKNIPVKKFWETSQYGRVVSRTEQAVRSSWGLAEEGEAEFFKYIIPKFREGLEKQGYVLTEDCASCPTMNFNVRSLNTYGLRGNKGPLTIDVISDIAISVNLTNGDKEFKKIFRASHMEANTVGNRLKSLTQGMLLLSFPSGVSDGIVVVSRSANTIIQRILDDAEISQFIAAGNQTFQSHTEQKTVLVNFPATLKSKLRDVAPNALNLTSEPLKELAGIGRNKEISLEIIDNRRNYIVDFFQQNANQKFIASDDPITSFYGSPVIFDNMDKLLRRAAKERLEKLGYSVVSKRNAEQHMQLQLQNFNVYGGINSTRKHTKFTFWTEAIGTILKDGKRQRSITVSYPYMIKVDGRYGNMLTAPDWATYKAALTYSLEKVFSDILSNEKFLNSFTN